MLLIRLNKVYRNIKFYGQWILMSSFICFTSWCKAINLGVFLLGLSIYTTHLQIKAGLVWLNSDCLWRESNFFGFNVPGHCLVCAYLLHCMHVWLPKAYTPVYAQIMQHTHTHKAVTGCAEAKKVTLSSKTIKL